MKKFFIWDQGWERYYTVSERDFYKMDMRSPGRYIVMYSFEE